MFSLQIGILPNNYQDIAWSKHKPLVLSWWRFFMISRCGNLTGWLRTIEGQPRLLKGKWWWRVKPASMILFLKGHRCHVFHKTLALGTCATPQLYRVQSALDSSLSISHWNPRQSINLSLGPASLACPFQHVAIPLRLRHWPGCLPQPFMYENQSLDLDESGCLPRHVTAWWSILLGIYATDTTVNDVLSWQQLRKNSDVCRFFTFYTANVFSISWHVSQYVWFFGHNS